MTPAYSARETAIDGVEVVQLSDARHGIEVSIAPPIGNIAYEMKAGGKNILWSPFDSPAELQAQPKLCGIPFLAPWANRLDGDAYWANGARYQLNSDLGNLRRDPNGKPIHGLMLFSEWTLAGTRVDDLAAEATSRFEFWKHPKLIAQFPFAHTITMTYRLSDGALEIETRIENLSGEPMPIGIGYHPYLRLDDAPRDDWRVHLAANEHIELNDLLIPTGRRRPMEFADPLLLAGTKLDDGFSNLTRDADGRAQFWVEGKRQRVTVSYGPKYPVAVVYAPPGGEFICFEPMAGVTNAFNLEHAGLYPELQSIPAGGIWKESFWIQPTGFDL
jgi:aldose 1-epimerase